MTSITGSAPGRLDLLGGVADYSGALVLEVPTHLTTCVVADPDDALVVGPVRVTAEEMSTLAMLPYTEVRHALASLPRWTHYVIGVALVLVRHGIIDPPRARLSITSDVPTSVGVSSSAALEVATARALAGARVPPLRLAALCQEAENQVVGAPCGIMDQVAVAVGRPGAVLPILCRPAAIDPPCEIPPQIEIVGVPTGAEHDVGGAPYHRARAAAFMGKRIVDDLRGTPSTWVSELPAPALADLPDTLTGAEFLERWRSTDDPLTVLEPETTYPVRASTTFGAEEHQRSAELLSAFDRCAFDAITPIMAASNAGYDTMGLGHRATTVVVEQVLSRPGVYGARSSGGGSGGTVVVVCDRGALDDVPGLIR
jgi:galactokinase